jgi:hypothetical protein
MNTRFHALMDAFKDPWFWVAVVVILLSIDGRVFYRWLS